MEKKRILFVSQEIFPFLTKSELSHNGRRLPQTTQEAGKEIRVFTPKFGSINERRHQLHEVQRLSGLNIVIDDVDHPLIIKVASIPAARLQVYFIDNDEFFKRKNNVTEDNGDDFSDNDERSMFFCRGVLETVKKLGWQPDVIYCQGWMANLMPLYIKKMYNKDPHFSNTKVITSIFESNEGFSKNWDCRFAEKLTFEGFDKETIAAASDTSREAIYSLLVSLSDGVVKSSESLPADLQNVFDNAACAKMDFLPEETVHKGLNEFFDKVLEHAEVV